jgi:hypothetical protein
LPAVGPGAASYPDRRRAVVTIDEVRAFASTLPRSSEALVRGRVKFRIRRIVYLSFSRDGTRCAHRGRAREVLAAKPVRPPLPLGSRPSFRYRRGRDARARRGRLGPCGAEEVPRNTSPCGAHTNLCRDGNPAICALLWIPLLDRSLPVRTPARGLGSGGADGSRRRSDIRRSRASPRGRAGLL